MVGDADTAPALGSGAVEVLGTPRLVALLEEATIDAVDRYLDDGSTTVSIVAQVDHLHPTPIGADVYAEAYLDEINEQRITFTVTASDSGGPGRRRQGDTSGGRREQVRPANAARRGDPPVLKQGVALVALLAACGGAAPRPIETLERTGVTAIEQSKALACNGGTEVLRQAIKERLPELEGHPPADQAALVAARLCANNRSCTTSSMARWCRSRSTAVARAHRHHRLPLRADRRR